MNYTPAFNFVSFVFSNTKGQNICKPTCRNCVCLVHRKVKAHACSNSEHHIIFLPRVSGGPNPTPNTLVQLACALVDVGLIIFGIVHFIQLVYYSSILGHPGIIPTNLLFTFVPCLWKHKYKIFYSSCLTRLMSWIWYLRFVWEI